MPAAAVHCTVQLLHSMAFAIMLAFRWIVGPRATALRKALYADMDSRTMRGSQTSEIDVH